MLNLIRLIAEYLRSESIDYIKLDVKMRENVFILLTLSPLIGLQLPFSYVSLKLLPKLLAAYPDFISRILHLGDEDELMNLFDVG